MNKKNSTSFYKKTLFKFILVFFILIITIKLIFTTLQNETRKILESDRFLFFLKRTLERNLETFSNYKPTDKEKIFYNKSFQKILNNWNIKDSEKNKKLSDK
jgi:hypothetical protein|tara:strand:+ start:485 stop:790 length:306 start_codon:yes stop_codon:yes gene_type:complete